MLTSYYVKNFKAFQAAEIAVRPLTLLIGPNNTGKTSITEVLLMMQQTAIATGTGYAAPLRINGRIVSLGAPEHLFHNKITDRPLVLGFRFVSRSLISDLRRLQARLDRNIYYIYRDVLRHYEVVYNKSAADQVENLPNPEQFRIQLRNSREMSDPVKLTRMREVISQLRLLGLDSMVKQSAPEIREELTFSNQLLHGNLKPLDSSSPDLEMTAQFVLGLNNISDAEFSIEFEFRHIETKPHIQLHRLKMLRGNQVVAEIGISANSNAVESLTSDLLPNDGRLNNYKTSLWKLMKFDCTVFATFGSESDHEARHFISEAIAGAFRYGLDQLMLCFTPQKLSHVSPIRAYPKRFYFSDQANSEQLEGDNYIEALRDNAELREKANHWLNQFGITVNVQQVRDVLHRAAIVQEGVDLDLDILDVGFGVSQVLPVLIQAFLVPKSGTAIVEQPEIHLHPKMQADLLDFFLDIMATTPSSLTESPHFILETHSVALLRRLRTRLVQRKELADSVAIYSVERSQQGFSEANMLSIDGSGVFKWPRDFLEAELTDTMQFLAEVSRKDE